MLIGLCFLSSRSGMRLLGTETQKGHFEMLKVDKELYVQEGAVHMDILEGSQQETVNRAQTDYMLRILGGNIER
jgi:hypothetical protein